jgi:hypothetical protein
MLSHSTLAALLFEFFVERHLGEPELLVIQFAPVLIRRPGMRDWHMRVV